MNLPNFYTQGTIGAAEEGSAYVSGQRSFGAPDPGVGWGDIFSLGKDALKILSPETYADITALLPDFGVTSAVDGLLGGGELAFMDSAAFGGGSIAGGGGLAGAAAAFAPVGAFLGAAMLAKAAAQPDDTSILLGAGESENLGDFRHTYGRSSEVTGLHDLFLGDRSWAEGGDATKVGRMPVGYGNMSVRDMDKPYWHVGGAPYRDQGLAVSSGRQIARGQMGLPVEHEALPNMYDPSNVAAGAQMMRSEAFPTYDAPATLPGNWDAMIHAGQQRGTGEGQNPVNQEYDAWYGGLNSRQQQWADTGLTTDRMYAFTGKNSPDYGTEVTDLSTMPGTLERPDRKSLEGYTWGALG